MANFYGDLARKAGSDNGSEVSDVDPAEMAKMLEGLDDMEADLFGSGLKNRKGKSPTAQAKSALKSPSLDSVDRPTKSRVTFNSPDKGKRTTPKKASKFDDFDADDPLADLLSDDDSDNKKTVKRASPARTSEPPDEKKGWKSKNVADLFGLNDDEPEEKNPPSLSPAKPKAVSPEPEPFTPSRANQMLDQMLDKKPTNTGPRQRSEIVKFDKDEDDIFDKLGLGEDTTRGSIRGPAGAKSNQGRKSVQEELLGKRPALEKEDFPTNQRERRKSASKLDEDFPLNPRESRKSVSKLDKDFPVNPREARKSVSKPEVHEDRDSGVSFGEYAPTVATAREGRRISSRRNTTPVGDPLGLFTPPTTPQRHSLQEGMGEYDRSPVKGRLPDWLAGDKEKQRGTSTSNPEAPSRSSHQAPKQSEESTDLPEWLGGKKKQAVLEEPPPPPQQEVAKDEKACSSVVGELFLNSQLEQQAVMALQRQEAALLAAAGLRAHEAQLSEVQRRQQALLEQQEAQLRQLVDRQVQRQKELEETLRAQQQRINTHMQALLTEPPRMVMVEPQVAVQAPVVTVSEPPASVAHRVSVGIQTDPESNEEAAENQMTLQKCELQNRYLEAKLENLEMKHKEEVQLLEECYKRQMTILEEGLEKQEARLRAENKRLEADYNERLHKMQEQHCRLVEEHGRQLATLQQERLADLQKLREQQQAMLEHMRQAQKAESTAIKDASQHMTSLQSTVELLSRSAGGLGELQGKLEEQQRLQNKAREAALHTKETELRALQESVEQQREAAEKENQRLRALEETLSKQCRHLEEEQRTIQRETERLQAEQQRLDSERQQVESMKLSLLEEQKVWRQQLSEERATLAVDKSRLETLVRLNTAPSRQEEVAQLKAEAEMQLAMAREATERAQLERNSLKEQQRHLDSERRRLSELEHDLTVRAREVEGLAQIAKSTRNEGVEALAEASRMERRQAEKASELEYQLRDIQEREQRLAQEKLSLSKERMSLRKTRDQKLCSSCRGALASPDHSRAASVSLSDRHFVDPKLVILKLAAEREREALENNLSALHSVSK